MRTGTLDFGSAAPLPPLTTTTLFTGRDPGGRHPERQGRGFGRLPRRDEHGRSLVDEFGEPETEVYGGHIEYARADKYDLDRRVSPLCKSIIEHIIGETHSAPPPKPRWCQSGMSAAASLALFKQLTGRQRRAIEMAIDEGVELGIIVREFPKERYNKGGYRVRLDMIAHASLREERIAQARQEREERASASVRAASSQAALRNVRPPRDLEKHLDRVAPSQDPAELAEQIALVERKLSHLRAAADKSNAVNNGKANNCPPATVQSAAATPPAQTTAAAAGAQSSAPRVPAQPTALARTAQTSALVAQQTLERAPSSDAPGAIPCPQCGTYLFISETRNQGRYVGRSIQAPAPSDRSTETPPPSTATPDSERLDEIAAAVPPEICRQSGEPLDRAALVRIDAGLCGAAIQPAPDWIGLKAFLERPRNLKFCMSAEGGICGIVEKARELGRTWQKRGEHKARAKPWEQCPSCASMDVLAQVEDGYFMARCQRCMHAWHGDDPGRKP